MRYSFQKSATYSDETCRTQQQQIDDIGSDNFANQESDYRLFALQ